MEAADDGAHAEAPLEEYFVVDLEADFVGAFLDEEEFEALVELPGKHVVLLVESDFERVHEVNHHVAVLLVLVSVKGIPQNLLPGPNLSIELIVDLHHVEVQHFSFEIEKERKLREEVLEKELSVDLSLAELWQLLHHYLVEVRLQEIVFVVLPFLVEEISDSLLQGGIDLIAIVELPEKREETLQLLNILNVAIHDFYSLDHEPEFAEDVGEKHDADQEYEGGEEALEVCDGVVVPESNS